MIIKTTDDDYFVKMGEALGYPGCCIEAFANFEHMGTDFVAHSGFVPCKEHAKLSREEIEKLIGRPLHKGDVIDYLNERGIIITW